MKTKEQLLRSSSISDLLISLDFVPVAGLGCFVRGLVTINVSELAGHTVQSFYDRLEQRGLLTPVVERLRDDQTFGEQLYDLELVNGQNAEFKIPGPGEWTFVLSSMSLPPRSTMEICLMDRTFIIGHQLGPNYASAFDGKIIGVMVDPNGSQAFKLVFAWLDLSLAPGTRRVVQLTVTRKEWR